MLRKELDLKLERFLYYKRCKNIFIRHDRRSYAEAYGKSLEDIMCDLLFKCKTIRFALESELGLILRAYCL